ncbi:MAG: YdcF family protein [Gemmatimonadetes bacterium]|nr:YdcF family protein [Gemmatimonadota bacterium]
MLIIPMGHKNDENGVLSKMFELRLQGALQEYRKNPDAKILVQGGFGHFNQSSHSSAHHASEYLIRQGVQELAIFANHDTTSTVEEALSAHRFAQTHREQSICVVTSHCHLERTQVVFEHFFNPEQLRFVSTTDSISPDELIPIVQHEKAGLKLIRDQGGVILEGRLFTRRKRKTKKAK